MGEVKIMQEQNPAAAPATVEVESTVGKKEVVSAGYAEQVAELRKLVDKAEELYKAGIISDKEFEQRLEKQRQRIVEEQKKNVQLGDDGTSKIGRSGVTWEQVMSLKTSNPDIIEVQKLQSQVAMAAMVLACKHGLVQPGTSIELAKPGITSRIPMELWERIPEFSELQVRRQLAAGSWWDTATSAGGSQWVPTGFARTAIEFYFLDAAIPALFQQVTIPQNVGPFSMPVETTRGQADIETEGTAAAHEFIRESIFSQPQTGVAQFTPLKHGIAMGTSMEGDEDLAIQAVTRLQQLVAEAMPRAAAQSIINGQPASSALLDDAPAVSGLVSADGYSVASGVNGLRLRCIVGSAGAFTTGVGGPLVATDILDARALMGDYGARETELACITSGMGYIGLLKDPNVLTVDKMGDRATIVQGQLAAAAGVPILFTSDFPSNMAATGIDAGTSTFSGAIVVNRTRWFFATKRNIDVILLPQPGMDRMNVIGRMRTHFVVASQTEHSTHYLIGVTAT